MRNKANSVVPIALLVIIVIVVASSVQTYRVSDGGDATLLSNANEAYLFLDVKRLGYRLSYLEYLGEMIREPFGVVRSPDDTRSFTVVLRITPSEVQRFETGDFDFFTPVYGRIYANHDRVLWKWVETHFEEASPEEQQKIGGVKVLSRKDFTDVDGWS